MLSVENILDNQGNRQRLTFNEIPEFYVTNDCHIEVCLELNDGKMRYHMSNLIALEQGSTFNAETCSKYMCYDPSYKLEYMHIVCREGDLVLDPPKYINTPLWKVLND